MIHVIEEAGKLHWGLNIKKGSHTLICIVFKIPVKIEDQWYVIYPKMRIRRWWKFPKKVRRIYFTCSVDFIGERKNFNCEEKGI